MDGQFQALQEGDIWKLLVFFILEKLLNPILPGGGGGKIRPLLFFFHHFKTAQGIKLKLSDFKDTPLTLSIPIFQKLAQAGGGAESAPSLNFVLL